MNALFYMVALMDPNILQGLIGQSTIKIHVVRYRCALDVKHARQN